MKRQFEDYIGAPVQGAPATPFVNNPLPQIGSPVGSLIIRHQQSNSPSPLQPVQLFPATPLIGQAAPNSASPLSPTHLFPATLHSLVGSPISNIQISGSPAPSLGSLDYSPFDAVERITPSTPFGVNLIPSDSPNTQDYAALAEALAAETPLTLPQQQDSIAYSPVSIALDFGETSSEGSDPDDVKPFAKDENPANKDSEASKTEDQSLVGDFDLDLSLFDGMSFPAI